MEFLQYYLMCTSYMYTCIWHIRAMADNAFEWAKVQGRLRTNPIHKAEEADIPFDFEWTNTKESGTRTEWQGSMEVEAACIIASAQS